MKQMHVRLGDSLLLLALWLWLTIAVGPWYVGVALYVGAVLANYLTRNK